MTGNPVPDNGPATHVSSIRRIWNFVCRHWKLFLAIAVVIGIGIAIRIFIFSPKKPEYVTTLSSRGRLVQTVEVVGTVISEKDLQLRFPVTGVIANVLVKEGNQIQKDQVLAELRNNTLKADVASAQADYQAALADLRELQEGTRPEEILIAEAEVENKRAALDVAHASLESAKRSFERSQIKLKELRKESNVSLQGHILTARSVLLEELTKIQNALHALDDDFNTSVIRHMVSYHESVRHRMYEAIKGDAVELVDVALSADPPSTFKNAIKSLEAAKDAAVKAMNSARQAYAIISSLPENQRLSVAVRETHKDSVATEREGIQDALHAIESEIKKMRDASANFKTKIATEEAARATAQGNEEKAMADIATFETALKIQEAQLALKKAGARKADIDASRALANRAQAKLQNAQARLEDTILRSPIDGYVTKVDLKIGEFTGGIEDASNTLSILGQSPYRIEVYASEIDIPKVEYGQEGTIELDAYPSNPFTLSVTEIGPSATIIDGVPKYRIKLDFMADVQDTLKIGMTGDAEIITGIQEDVVMVPGRAVLTNDNEAYIVRVRSGDEIEEREVTLGMETYTDVEIISGIDEGEDVVVLIKK